MLIGQLPASRINIFAPAAPYCNIYTLAPEVVYKGLALFAFCFFQVYPFNIVVLDDIDKGRYLMVKLYKIVGILNTVVKLVE